MASDQEQLLQLRQMELRLRSTELRMRLVQDGAGLHRPFTLADRAYHGYQWLRANPVWTLGGTGGLAAALLVLKPSRMMRWASRGLWLWRLMGTLGRGKKR